jgi:hypothetical protein
MDEKGSYPGQPWSWLYTLRYQLQSFRPSANVDLIAINTTDIGTFLLLASPFIPGLRFVAIDRLIWRGGRPGNSVRGAAW